ncbi:MAG: TonB-dependent receptor [Myxococcota bacterium]
MKAALLILWLAAPDELVEAPTLVTNVEPAYPAEALRERIRARVELEITIDVDGSVSNAGLVKIQIGEGEASRDAAADDYGFVRSALAAARELRFTPARSEDGPVSVRVGFTFGFEPPREDRAESPVESLDASVPAAAPTPSIQIEAVERGSGDPVVGATVIVSSALNVEIAYEAVTDESGSATFYSMEAGPWRIRIEQPGYYPYRSTETVVPGEVVEARYFVERGRYSPYDVTVAAERPRKEVTRRSLDAAIIDKVPGGLSDTIRVVENLPGVARTPTASADIIVRGSGPADTGVFVNGTQIPQVFHFGGLRSVIAPQMVEQLDFFPGNFSTYYGRFTGGVLDVQLRAPGDETRASIDVNTLDASLFLETPLSDTVSISLAGRRSYVDLILNAALSGSDFVSINSAPVYYDYQTLVAWRPSREHEVLFSLLGSDDRLEILFENPAALDPQFTSGDSSNNTGFQRLQARYRYQPSPQVKNEFVVAVGQDDFELRFGGLFFFDLDTREVQLRDELRWVLDESLTLRTGFDGRFSTTDALVRASRPPREGDAGNNLDLSPLTTDEENIEALDVAGYLEAQWQPVPWLELIPGARVDSFSRLDAVTFDPRIVARVPLNRVMTAKAGAALTHQSPTIQELDPVFGNPDLDPIRAAQYAGGVELAVTPQLDVELTGFFKDISSLPSSSGRVVEREGELVPEVLNSEGEGRVIGLEVFVEQRLYRGLTGWLSYTLSRAERTDFGESDSRPFDFDQTHILSAVALYELPENWSVGVRWRYVTGNPLTPVTGSVFFSDLDQFNGAVGAVNSGRVGDFHQLDIRFDKSWVYQGWALSAYLNLTNAYNRANPEDVSYNFDFSEQEASTGLPLYPIFGLRADI